MSASSAMVSSLAFDRDKFVDAVHYICARCSADPDALGKTKLHKALYYADMLCYLQTGQPLTGVDYIKQPFGPTARHLGWALQRLSEDKAIVIKKRDYFGLGKFDFVSLKQPQSNRLSEHERSTLDAVIDFVCGFTAKEISEISHAAPWASVSFGARIPYETAFLLLPQSAPSQHDLQWARSVSPDAYEAGIDEIR